MLKIFGGFLLGRRSVGVFRASSNGTVGSTRHAEYNATATGVADCVVQGLSNSGLRSGLDRPASWLLGQFDLSSAPRWGPAERLDPPPTHSRALLIQNQDENRNVWSTVVWAAFVNASSILELDPVHGTLRPFLDDSPWEKGTQIAIDAGGARLLVIQTVGAAPPAPAPAPLPPVPVPPPPPSLNNSIDTFGYYWAMQDGSSSTTAKDGRNCSGADCSWTHATSAFVQNSWKHPERWTTQSGAWDLSDCALPRPCIRRTGAEL